MSYWGTFANTGNPNAAGQPGAWLGCDARVTAADWPQHQAGSNLQMYLTTPAAYAAVDVRAAYCQFWDQLVRRRAPSRSSRARRATTSRSGGMHCTFNNQCFACCSSRRWLRPARSRPSCTPRLDPSSASLTGTPSPGRVGARRGNGKSNPLAKYSVQQPHVAAMLAIL